MPGLKTHDDYAKWLDEVKPGWASLIDFDNLSMQDTYRCVLGQAFADECGSGYVSGYAYGYDLARKQGFSHALTERDGQHYSVIANTSEWVVQGWRDEVNKRLNTEHNPTFTLADLRYYLDAGKTLADIVNINTEVSVTLTVAEVEALRDVIRWKRNPSALLRNAAERLANV